MLVINQSSQKFLPPEAYLPIGEETMSKQVKNLSDGNEC